MKEKDIIHTIINNNLETPIRGSVSFLPKNLLVQNKISDQI
jgi:hypothetical protein